MWCLNKHERQPLLSGDQGRQCWLENKGAGQTADGTVPTPAALSPVSPSPPPAGRLRSALSGTTRLVSAQHQKTEWWAPSGETPSLQSKTGRPACGKRSHQDTVRDKTATPPTGKEGSRQTAEFSSEQNALLLSQTKDSNLIPAVSCDRAELASLLHPAPPGRKHSILCISRAVSRSCL